MGENFEKKESKKKEKKPFKSLRKKKLKINLKKCEVCWTRRDHWTALRKQIKTVDFAFLC